MAPGVGQTFFGDDHQNAILIPSDEKIRLTIGYTENHRKTIGKW
jgi:hypothetical protein